MSDRRLFKAKSPHLILPGLVGITASAVVVAGSITLTASGDFTVPFYNTIQFELYSGGGGGSADGPGSQGGATTLVALALSCPGGRGGVQDFPPVAAVPSGFNTLSINGNTNIGTSGCAGVGPLGGAAPLIGVDGNPYSAGGGAGIQTGGSGFGDGGEGGCYGKHILTRLGGGPAVGTILAFVIGGGGARNGSYSTAPGNGAAGAAVITWS